MEFILQSNSNLLELEDWKLIYLYLSVNPIISLFQFFIYIFWFRGITNAPFKYLLPDVCTKEYRIWEYNQK